MQTNFIPKGYRLTVNSWENDADAHQEKVFEGLSKEGLEFAIAFASLFKSKSRFPGCFGNVFEHEYFSESDQHALVRAVKDLLNKHPIGRPNLDDIDDEDIDIQIDCILDLLSSFTGGGEFYIRAVESFTIDYFDKDVEYITLAEKEIKDHAQ